MPKVYCPNDTCAYRDVSDGCCTKDFITLDDYADYAGCENYTDYSSLPEYQEEYWIAVSIEKNKDKLGRAMVHGKKLEINGVEFFTRSNSKLNDDDIYVTDMETGFYCGSVKTVKEKWERFLKKKEDVKNKIPNLMDLPICEFCGGKNCYIIKQEG